MAVQKQWLYEVRQKKISHSRVFGDETLYFTEKGTAQITAQITEASVKNYVKLTDKYFRSKPA
mgnify:CR=1 FL=1